MRRFDPARYPGRRPVGPTWVTDTTERALDLAALLDADDPAGGPDDLPPGDRDDARCWVTAFEARITGYGAVPLTLVPRAGATTPTWVLGLHRRLTPLLDRTEGRARDGAPARIDPAAGDAHRAPPGTYQLARVGTVAVAGTYQLADALAYVPGPGTEVQVDAEGWRTWPARDQASARHHLAHGGPSAPAPQVADPVLGAWPSTRLTDVAGRAR
ncbi:MAG: hypothetical protein ACNA8R_01965 [Nitriliruptoraceae bacterium]